MKGQKKNLKNYNIDEGWTLFLDRDGVINKRKIDDYVKSWDEFEFIPGVQEAISRLTKHFEKIIIVSNQQGIGKMLMSEKDLELIHQRMNNEIKKKGGTITNIYFCPYLEAENSINRKPEPGMGYMAKKDFPDIDFKKSVMVGDSITDMQFGRNLGMVNVFITTEKIKPEDKDLIDFVFPDLFSFAELI